jgi:tetratricopeptide (TPR) repeat protein
MKKWREALVSLGKALWLNPKEMGPYIGIGWCWKRLGNLNRAIEILKDALKVEKNYPLACYNLSCYYALKNEGGEALVWLQKAIALDAQFARLCREEPDFNAIRDLPEFSALTEHPAEEEHP